MSHYDVPVIPMKRTEIPEYVVRYADETAWATPEMEEARAEIGRYPNGDARLETHSRQYIHVEPADLYDNTIARIVEVLGIRAYWAEREMAEPPYQDYLETKRALGSVPFELMPLELDAPTSRGGGERMYVLLRNALALPEAAWEWALIDRDQFYPMIPYIPRADWLEQLSLPGESREVVGMVQARGHALEVALGWFLHALRLKIGGGNVDIGRDLRYRL